MFQEEICPYPCTCPSNGVCSECEECPRQLGEPCSVDIPCDIQKGYVCKYKHGDSEGICRGKVFNLLNEIQIIDTLFIMRQRSKNISKVIRMSNVSN